MNRKLEETIRRIVKNVISEMVKNNLSYREFVSDMHKMGFVEREGEGSARVFFIPKYGDSSSVTIHSHNEGGRVQADALRMVKSVLDKIGWFNEPNNVGLFPWGKWQISQSNLTIDTTTKDIQKANEQYKDAIIQPIFQMKDSICALITPQGVNLCKNSQDRRPILPLWYDSFDYDNKTNRIPCLKKDNYETFQTEAYPIKVDGTLDTEKIIIESKIYGKSSNRMHKRVRI